MKKGVSLIEVMVVVIIIGVLASLAVPNLSIILERNKIRSAEFNLQSIYNAEKRFRLNNESGQFYTIETAESDPTGAINRNLSLRIDEPHFSYTIVKSGKGYQAIATRLAGKCENKTLSVSWNNATVVKQECTGW